MDPQTAKRNIFFAIVMLIIAAMVVLVGALVVYPKFKADLQEKTSVSANPNATVVTLYLDNFAGYSVFRSDRFTEDLAQHNIELRLENDGAAYNDRLKALRDGRADLAVFTLDAELVAGADLDEFPASIVMLIDESADADGAVAYTTGLKTLDDLNNPKARIVAVPDSPSETLARAIVANLALPNLSKDWLVPADDPRDLMNRLRNADPQAPYLFVFWEPTLSKARAIPNVEVLFGSGKLRGLIVDELLVNRRFLSDHPDIVRTIVAIYQRVLFAYQSEPEGLARLVYEDGQKTGEIISRDDAKRISESIQWKGVLENYAHFGLLPETERGGLLSIDTMANNIAEVLVQTGKLKDNPVVGQTHILYYDGVLRELRDSNFHPRRELGTASSMGEEVLTMQGQRDLPALTDDEWNNLAVVGNMRVPSISFRRASAELSVEGQRQVDGLIAQLQSWPDVYLTIVGQASAEGDTEANRALAEARATAVLERIIASGISQNRMRAAAAAETGRGGDFQSVRFIIGQTKF